MSIYCFHVLVTVCSSMQEVTFYNHTKQLLKLFFYFIIFSVLESKHDDSL